MSDKESNNQKDVQAQPLANLLTSNKEIGELIKGLVYKPETTDQPKPDPVDPHDYLNKIILYRIGGATNVHKGSIKRVSKNGILEIQEVHTQNEKTYTNVEWYQPQEVFILDVLEHE
jgi:hypothetical protein